MKLNIVIASQRNPKQGYWFELPSQAAVQKMRALEDDRENPFIAEIESNLEVEYLKAYSLSMLNQLAEEAASLPEKVLENLHELLVYESLDKILETKGGHFIFREATTAASLAKSIVEAGEIEAYMEKEELITGYLDFEGVGNALLSAYSFFKGHDGIFIEHG